MNNQAELDQIMDFDYDIAEGIGKLPDDVLLMIFELLGYAELKGACLVSKRWNEVISFSSLFLNKTVFQMASSRRGKSGFSFEDLEFGRPYHHVAISSILPCIMEGEIIEKMESIGAKLKTLEIENIQVSTTCFMRLMKSLPQLQSCVFTDVSISDANNEESNTTVEMKNLRSLKLFSSDKMLIHIRCTKLIDLAIRRGSTAISTTDHIVEFLNRLDELDNLKLYETYFLPNNDANFTDYADTILCPKFALKKLDIHLSGQASPSLYEIIFKNIATWRNLIRSLGKNSKICIHLFEPSRSLIKIIKLCADNNKISGIVLSLNGLLPDFEINRLIGLNLLQLKHIKSLELLVHEERQRNDVDNAVTDDRTDQFLKLFPNIESLKLDSPSVRRINPYTTATTFKNVRELSIESLFEFTNIPPVTFPNLETLIIDVFVATELDFLKQFVREQESLKHVKLGFEGSVLSWSDYIVMTLYMFVRRFETLEIAVKSYPHTIRKTRSEIELKQFGHILSQEMRDDFQNGIDEAEDMRM